MVLKIDYDSSPSLSKILVTLLGLRIENDGGRLSLRKVGRIETVRAYG